MFPDEFESCDWRLSRRGKPPRFWRYVKHGACFWLVNFNLHLAQLMEPHRLWRIVWSERYATVWDGDRTLFDLNFIAMEVSTKECWRLANAHHLGVGRRYRVGYPVHWWDARHAPEPGPGTTDPGFEPSASVVVTGLAPLVAANS